MPSPSHQPFVSSNFVRDYQKIINNKIDMVSPGLAFPRGNDPLTGNARYLAMQRDTEYLISQILAMAPSIDKGISKILQAIGENFDWDLGTFFRIDTLKDKICCDQIWVSHLAKSTKVIRLNQNAIFSPGVELPGLVWQSRKPLWIPDLANESNSLRAVDAVKAGLKSTIVFPVCLREKILGVIEFFSFKTKCFDKILLQTLDAIGNQVGQFIKHKNTEKHLKQAYEEMEQRVKDKTRQLMGSNLDLQAEMAERKRIEKEILEIPLQEQRRFGTELHDGLCQELTGILMFITNLTKKMEKENSPDTDHLKKIEVLLLESIRQARDTARGLYPGEMESASFIGSLEELTCRIQSDYGMICQFYCPEFIHITNDVAMHLYRIAQEGITNAVKHGGAKNIDISFTQKEGKVVFMVKDNGRGITHDPDHKKGIGLNIMKYRAHLMDATFQVESNIPHGVILKFCFDNKIIKERTL